MSTEAVLEFLNKVPWLLLLTLFGIPYLRQLAKKIKDERLREAYLAVVRYIEMTYGAKAPAAKKLTGAKKKLEATAVIVSKGLALDPVLLEAAVHEVKRESAAATTKACDATAGTK